MSLNDRDRAHVWHPYTQMLTQPPPLPIVRGEGVYLYTEDGRKILDGISSWWVNIHGHSHPKLNAALAEQAQEIEQVIFAGCTHRPAVELAERLVEVMPAGAESGFLFGQWVDCGRGCDQDGGAVLAESRGTAEDGADHAASRVSRGHGGRDVG